MSRGVEIMVDACMQLVLVYIPVAEGRQTVRHLLKISVLCEVAM